MNSSERTIAAVASPAPRAQPLAPSENARRGALATIAQRSRAIVPYVNFAAQRLGRVGIVGVALCVFSTMVFVSTLGPLRNQIASDSLALEDLASASDAPTSVTASTPQGALEGFLGELPTREDLPALMGQIVAVSTSTGVALEEGNYELASVGRSGLIARYRLNFPLVGTYPQIRNFIDQSLVAIPAMSLDSVSLERSDVGDALVTADLDFAVFVRTR